MIITKKYKKQLFTIFFPLEGNFDIDAGMGGHLGPKKSKKITINHKNIFRARIVHTSGTFFKKCQKQSQNNIFTYTENDTESEKHLQNNNS